MPSPRQRVYRNLHAPESRRVYRAGAPARPRSVCLGRVAEAD